MRLLTTSASLTLDWSSWAGPNGSGCADQKKRDFRSLPVPPTPAPLVPVMVGSGVYVTPGLAMGVPVVPVPDSWPPKVMVRIVWVESRVTLVHWFATVQGPYAKVAVPAPPPRT